MQSRIIGLLSIVAVAVFATAASAQLNTNGSSQENGTSKPAIVSSANSSDREKELLARIERLEKRLEEIERRSAAGPKEIENPTVAASSAAAGDARASKPQAKDTSSSARPKSDGPKFVEEGILPHSFKIPGTDLSLKLGGYIKADFIQDFDGIGNRSQFAVNTIPIDGTPNADLGGGTTIQARESRVTLEIVGPEDKRKFRVYVEGDFYGGDGNNFRLRQAYGEYGSFLAGQTWTTFMDIDSRPRTLDYEGPDGEIFVRQAMLRWTQQISRNWKFAIAAEEPTVQIGTPAGFTGSPRGYIPDITGFLRFHNKRVQLHFGGIARSLRFDGTGSTPDDTTAGWGANAAFKAGTWGKDHVMGQFAFGSGISRYIESMAGQNVDALFGGPNGLVAVPARSGTFGYERHWTPKLMSAFAYSIADISRNSGFGGSVIKRTQDARVNLIWTPFRLVDLGVEYLWGRRDNQDGSRGEASRLQFSTIYRFN